MHLTVFDAWTITFHMNDLSPEQCRAARGLLKWSQDALASSSDVGVVAIRKFENELAEPRRATLAAIRRAFEEAGVEFIERGVRLRDDIPTPTARD